MQHHEVRKRMRRGSDFCPAQAMDKRAKQKRRIPFEMRRFA